jgi:hypothetical protein
MTNASMADEISRMSLAVKFLILSNRREIEVRRMTPQ